MNHGSRREVVGEGIGTNCSRRDQRGIVHGGGHGASVGRRHGRRLDRAQGALARLSCLKEHLICTICGDLKPKLLQFHVFLHDCAFVLRHQLTHFQPVCNSSFVLFLHIREMPRFRGGLFKKSFGFLKSCFRRADLLQQKTGGIPPRFFGCYHGFIGRLQLRLIEFDTLIFRCHKFLQFLDSFRARKLGHHTILLLCQSRKRGLRQIQASLQLSCPGLEGGCFSLCGLYLGSLHVQEPLITSREGGLSLKIQIHRFQLVRQFTDLLFLCFQICLCFCHSRLQLFQMFGVLIPRSNQLFLHFLRVFGDFPNLRLQLANLGLQL